MFVSEFPAVVVPLPNQPPRRESTGRGLWDIIQLCQRDVATKPLAPGWERPWVGAQTGSM
jgi:hypothetical protein